MGVSSVPWIYTEASRVVQRGLKDKMEIIFVSSDRDEASFNDYFKEMPWLALPFDKREAKEALSEACGVQGILSFAVINPDGTIITTDGRSKVAVIPRQSLSQMDGFH